MQDRSKIEEEIEDEIFSEQFLIPNGIWPAKIIDFGNIKELQSGRGFYLPISLKVDGYQRQLTHMVGWMPAISMLTIAKPYFVGKVVDVKFRITTFDGKRKYNDARPIWDTLRELES